MNMYSQEIEARGRELVKEFKPDSSGKYSKGIYKWLLDNKHQWQIWNGNWSFAFGLKEENHKLYIGIMDDDFDSFHGVPLVEAHKGAGKYAGYAFGKGHGIEKWENITDKFYVKYRLVGICAITDYEHQWNESVGARECSRCGKRQNLKEIVVKKATWVDA